MKNSLHRFGLWLTTTGFVLLSACGGGYESSITAAPSSPSTNSSQSSNGDASTSAQLSAYVSKGPITGGTCEARDVDDKLLASSVPKNGLVSFGTLNYSGIVKVSCSGGQYTDEATKTSTTLSMPIHSVTSLNGINKEVVVTPLTEVAYQKANADASKFSTFAARLSETAASLGLDTSSSGAGVAGATASSNIDYSSIRPKDFLSQGADTASTGQYAALLAAISQAQADGKPLATLLGNSDTLKTELSTSLDKLVNANRIPGGVRDKFKKNREQILVGGKIKGLASGKSLSLSNITAAASTPTTSATTIATFSGNGQELVYSFVVPSNTAYNIAVNQQPNGQYCKLDDNASNPGTTGSGDSASVSNINISCSSTAGTLSVGGSLSGLGSGNTLVLQNNGGDDLTRTSNGSFNFATKLTPGSSYRVSIKTQPSGQLCMVSNGTGTVQSASISNISVTCVSLYSVGGTLSGLGSGKTLVLQNNGGDDLTLSSNGSFNFATKLTAGSSYDVGIKTQPAGQTCTIAHGAGSVNNTNISNVAVTCAASTYSVGGTLSGLGSGKTLVLQNNGGDNLTLGSNGSFNFATKLASGSNYSVSVNSQPADQTCSVTNSTGTMASANVSNISVSCTNNPAPTYSVGGTLSGLGNGKTIVLQNNGRDDLTLGSNGSFSFVTKLAAGSSYDVGIKTQPAGQTCTLSNGAGSIISTNVSSVGVSCTNNPAPTYSVGGTLSGLGSGKTLVLQNNGGDDLTLSSNGSFSFATKLTAGSSYDVGIKTQPAGQSCTTTHGAGAVASADVSDITVSCQDTPAPSGITIRQVDVVQALSQEVNSGYQLLVPGRSAMVRAYVYRASTATSPSVTLTVGSSAPVTMTCPATLPVDPGTTTTVYSYSNADVCVATLSADQVSSGLTLKVDAGSVSRTLTPAVNTKSTIDVVVVPLKTAGVDQLNLLDTTALATLKAKLLQRLPVKDINLSLRATYTPQRTTSLNLTGSGQWSGVLSELEAIRASENSSAFYYGVVPFDCVLFQNAGGGAVGLGYIGHGQPTTAIGFNSNLDACAYSAWWQTAIHELGHTLSLLHAPCGSPSDVDPAWTDGTITWTGHANAKLSPAALYNGTTLIDPVITGTGETASGTDVMAYCEGEWFSEYSYNKVAKYLRDNASTSSLNLAAKSDSSTSSTLANQAMLRISGEVDAQGNVTLNPTLAATGLLTSADAGRYQLSLTTRSGQTINRRFVPLQVADAPTTILHFAVNLPDPGDDIISASVTLAGRELRLNQRQPYMAKPTANATPATGASAQAQALAAGEVSLSEAQGTLAARWDASKFAWLSLTHIANDGKRTVLGIHAEGGAVQIPLGKLPAGGRWEASLSNGLTTRRVSLAR